MFISFLMSQAELSTCKVSSLWAHCHQLPQIQTTPGYERPHSQIMLVLIFSMENMELEEICIGKYTHASRDTDY